MALPSLCVLLENPWILAQLQEEGKKIEGSKKLGGRKGKVKQTGGKKRGEERQERHTNPYLPSCTEREENLWGKATTLPIIQTSNTHSIVALILRRLAHISVIFSLAYVQINQSKSPFSREVMSSPARSSAILSHWSNLYPSVCLFLF